MPAVLGPISAVLFVVAVYLCRRHQLDGRPPSTVKRAPAARLGQAHLPQTVAEYRKRTAASRIRGGIEAGMDEETRMMLPCAAASAALFVNPPPTRMLGKRNCMLT